MIMSLIYETYELGNEDITVRYTSTSRVPGPGIDPLFLIAPRLTIDLGKGPVDYSSSEVGRSELSPPGVTALTVTVERSIDAGATLFSVLLPLSVVPGEDLAAAPVEAVAFRTTVRTFLADVGWKFPEQSYEAHVLKGTYTRKLTPPVPAE
ncbi:hypothetical protein ACPC54_41330 [Kitasatospora sp. NPDC094028]